MCMYICVIGIGRGCMLGYPIEGFERARREVDPDNVLGGTIVDALFTR